MRKLKDSGVEWIGQIPEGWKIQRLKTVCTVRGEKNKPDAEVLSVYRELGVVKKSERTDNHNITSDDTSNYKYVLPNDLVVNKMKAWQGSMGVSKYEGIVSPAYYVFRITSDKVYPFYLHYLLRDASYLPEYRRLSGGIRPGQWDLSVDSFQNIPILIPKKEEQRRIASYLDRKCAQIDAIIAKQQQIIEKLKEYKLSVITEAVTKGLDPNVPMKDSGVEWIGKVPETWNVMRFGRCATIKSNLVDPSQYSDYPQISPESIEKDSNHIIEYKTVKESGVISWNHLFFKGQIIYSKIRPLLNKVTIAPFNGLCSADMYPIETNNNADFIVHMMLSIYFTAQVGQVTETRVKMPKINQNELNAIIVAIPPLKEQTKIADYLHYKNDTIEKMINKRQNLIDKLLNYKKALIYETVTGKKEV